MPNRIAPTTVQLTSDVLWEAVDDKGIRGRLYREDCDYLARVLTSEGIVPSAVMKPHWCNPSCEDGCTIGDIPEQDIGDPAPVDGEAVDEPSTDLSGGGNPILGDALAYFAQRRTLNNPKGWAHVLRVTESAVTGGIYDATDPQTTEALAVLRHLAATEDSARQAIDAQRAFVAAATARRTAATATPADSQ